MQERIQSFVETLRKNEKIGTLDAAATKNAIILKLLSLLGWDPFDIDEVTPEYSVGSSRVDYSLRLDGSNKLFIEVKRIQEDLENHQEQLLSYSFKQGVRLSVLTNGLTWWFYLPLLEGTWEDRRFYSIDIVQQTPDSVAARFAAFLSRDNIATGKAFENAERAYKSRKKATRIKEALPKAWNKLITEKDEILMDLLSETTETLCGYKPDTELVKGFVSGHKSRLLISAEPKPPRDKKRPKVVKDKRDYTGKKPLAYVFQGRRHEVRSWKDVLMGCCKIISRKKRRDFSQTLHLRGKTRPYFSRKPGELRAPAQIDGTTIFAETDFGANAAVKRCELVLSHFGYPNSDLEIEGE